jgi:ATP-dependent DNA helicase RecG
MTIPGDVIAALAAIHGGATAASFESDRLDFKEDARTEKESHRIALEAALCFANAAGGSVVFGVKDEGAGPSAFVGSGLTIAEVRKYVYDNSRPHLLVHVQELTERGARLVVLVARPDNEIHSDSRGRVPHRVGTDCVGMDPAAVQRAREDRQGYDPSSEITQDSRVDASALARARGRLEASLRPERAALSKLSDNDLLRALSLASPSGQLLNAGHWLLGPEGVDLLYTYRETPGGEPRVIERFTGPLLLVYDRAMELVALRRQLTPVTLPDGQQLQVEDFPEIAVREALGNALIHRDYRVTAPVVVEHSPSVFTVTSPGPLVAGVTVENILTHPSKPRNRVLARSVTTLELAEEVGRGVDRMYREMIRSGRPTPIIEATFEQVRVALVGGAPDINIARYVAQIDPAVRDDTDAMIVLLRLCTARTVNAERVAPLLQKSPAEAESSLRHLAAEQIAIIEPTRQTVRAAHPNYRFREQTLKQLGSAVTYARHTSDELDRRVVAHVREYDRVTNQTVQNLFNVSMSGARQILASLVRREILVKTSKAQRGPSVEYGPGPHFPPKEARRRPKSTTGQASDQDQPQLPLH